MNSDPFQFSGKSNMRKPRKRTLSENQQTILSFIHGYLDRTGSLPSVRLIAEEALGKAIGPRTAHSYIKRIAAQKHLEMLDDHYSEAETQKRKERKETPYRLPTAESPARIPILMGLVSGHPSGQDLLLRLADMRPHEPGVPDAGINVRTADIFGVRLTEANAVPPLPAGALLICSRKGPRALWVAKGEILRQGKERVSVHSAPSVLGTTEAWLRAVVWMAV